MVIVFFLLTCLFELSVGRLKTIHALERQPTVGMHLNKHMTHSKPHKMHVQIARLNKLGRNSSCTAHEHCVFRRVTMSGLASGSSKQEVKPPGSVGRVVNLQKKNDKPSIRVGTYSTPPGSRTVIGCWLLIN